MINHLIAQTLRCLAKSPAAVLLLAGMLHAEEQWWNKDWVQRQKLTLDASAIKAPVESATLLLRLSDANFQFTAAREDGSDIRIVAADGKTVLPHQIETYDSMLNEGFVWVKVPEIKPGEKQSFFLYYGNQDPAMPAAENPAKALGEEFAAVYHFSERGAPAKDATTHGNNAAAPSAIAESAIVGSGLRLLGSAPVTLQVSESMTWTEGESTSISMWIKPAALQSNAVVLSRSEGNASFKILIDQGAPLVDIKSGAASVRSQPGGPLAVNTWSHLVVVAEAGKIQLFVNGEPYASADGQLPALNSPVILGGVPPDAAQATGFIGDLDEIRIMNSAMTPAAVMLSFINQSGSEASLKMLALAAPEGGKEAGGSVALEHMMLFGDIAKNMMFDGWIAIGVCVLMIIVGWTVAIKKFVYLNKIEKGNREFLKLWKKLSTDLTAIDHADEKTIKNMGGSIDEDDQELMKDSPLYHIYHIGSNEIRNRIHKMSDKMEGLPGRSIQAIRASLDAGLVHENHRLTDGLVYLTISIAGGPYVGLLGTVVGVMITFAIIAKSGEVNVNSIAPGIASALLATVVGLVVAIPALFIYSYLNGRIKNVLSSMQVFIDEFVAKMAEFYRPPNDGGETSK